MSNHGPSWHRRLSKQIQVQTCNGFVVQSYPGYPNTFGQRGLIGCSDKRNCSDNPNETFLAIYILYNIKSMYEGRALRPLQFTLYTMTYYCVPTLNMYV